MQIAPLRSLREHLCRFESILLARRVKERTIELRFIGGFSLFIQMGSPARLYSALSVEPPVKFEAPFDKLLHSYVSGAMIVQIAPVENDRVLSLKLLSKNSYKNRISTLHIELTSRHANVILCDEEGCVIEALRHVDSMQSYRVVRPGVALQPLPEYRPKHVGEPLEDVVAFLEQEGRGIHAQELSQLRKSKLAQVGKKLKQLQLHYKKLPSLEMLEQRAAEYELNGQLILANLHTIKPYDTLLECFDFEGKQQSVELPSGMKPSQMARDYFDKAKRAKSKARHLHIEVENLEGKIAFYERLLDLAKSTQVVEELNAILPKRNQSKKRKSKGEVGEIFWIEGYKVIVGRSSSENQQLLTMMRSNDLWMHVREISGSHLFIKSDKQQLSKTLLEKAAKLCVDFSTKHPGDYLVDYTRRRYVKIQEGSRVEYDKYETLSVTKEGVEIRL